MSASTNPNNNFNSLKRGLSTNGNASKRMKLINNTQSMKEVCAYGTKYSVSSSEDEDESDFDEDVNRSINIGSPIVDQNLSRAVGQYSDDEGDDDNEGSEDEENDLEESRYQLFQRRSNSILNVDYNNNDRDLPLTNRSNSTNKIINTHSRGVLNNKRYSINVADLVSSNSNNRHNGIPQSDYLARSRCFDYLVNAIDEAWSRYCDGTSYEEDIAYDYDNESFSKSALTPMKDTSDDEEGYKSELSNYTSVTEYDSDNAAFKNGHRAMSIMNTQRPNININSENYRLQELKDRLTKTKYILEEFVDSCYLSECISFWKKWDMIKYSTIELVEDDDEDDTVEMKIEELEKGRYWGSFT